MKCRQKALQEREEHWLVLRTGSEDHNSRVRARRVGLDVREIQIQRDQDPVFRTTANKEDGIVCSRKVLLRHSCRLETCFAKERRTFRGEILVDLKFQAVVSRGRSTVPSRASSAA